MKAERFISPPKAELDRLRTPLEPGEREVFEWLDENLAPAWEIYVQPHLNGLRPDFVLLHPKAGIIVIEVKDWDLSSDRYRLRSREEAAPFLEIKTDAGWKSYEVNNPVSKLHLYRDEIQNLYCPSLQGQQMHYLVSGAAIFPRAHSGEVQDLLRESLNHYFKPKDYPLNCALIGSDSLASEEFALRMALNTNPPGMTEAIASELRHWLIEPEYSAEQRVVPDLKGRHKELTESRTSTGYRKIKGPAGSGKSLVLAGRAAKLLADGKSVLVITYNLTLINYLQDLVVRWPMPPDVHARRDIVWLNFHAWCRRAFLALGETEAYRSLWKKHFEAAEKKAKNTDSKQTELKQSETKKTELSDEQLESIFNEAMAKALGQAIDQHPELLESYDAVLVDEGQDFRPAWITLLRRAVKPADKPAEGGEFILVADKSQNIYGTAHLLTEGAMEGCGFPGKWSELSECHRMPIALIPLVSDFASRFLPADSRDLPVVPKERQTELPYYFFGRWVQHFPVPTNRRVIDEVLRLAASKDIEHLPISDITLIVFTQFQGLELVQALEAKGIGCLHTFAPDDRRESRRLKTHFYKGAALVKVTTIHSFKGLECRALVIAADAPTEKGLKSDQLALLYTAMTRLKHTERGAYLTIVCNHDEMADYGRTWPQFVKPSEQDRDKSVEEFLTKLIPSKTSKPLASSASSDHRPA